MAVQVKDLSKTAIARGRWRKVKFSVLRMNLLTYLQKKAVDRNYALFNQGTYVWLPDDVEQFVPAKVTVAFERGSSGQVERLDTGEIVNVSTEISAELLRLDEESLAPMEDMVQLKELAERSILHNIRMRFNEDKIYTSVGTILVAINPFKAIDGMYSPEVLTKYSTTLMSDPTSTLPPHIFEVAARSYHSLLADKLDQSVVVSGESGAGKTEATKHVLRFLTSVAASGETGGDGKAVSSVSCGTLQDQILMANPVMEAFGNAKTIRNNNSSRFGKWIKVDLHSTTGKIIGGSITSYLLEKSRIVGQAPGERNYHIFYQLCSIRDPKERSRWKLGKANDFAYLNGGGDGVSNDVDDEAELLETYEAMEALGVEKDTVDNIMQLLSGLLHLGNLQFEERFVDSTDGSQVSNQDVLNDACEMLGLEAEAVQKCMCETVVKAGREVLPRHNVPGQASVAQDTLVKYVYDHLFQWIIATINESFEKLRVVTKSNDKQFVGVLDIFGFESFIENSLEQLCINFCNEKLQNFFNEYIFKLELKEYEREGVDVSGIKFENNEVCLALIEGRPTGVLAVLDDSVGASRNDSQFLSQIQKVHKEHTHFPKVHPRNQQTHFQVFHFAGVVEYAVEGFVEKSKNKVPSLMEELIVSEKSSKSFVSTLFPDLKKKLSSGDLANGARAGAKKSKDTVGSQFKGQLDSLVAALCTTTPHFVRCIKPNDEKTSSTFTSQMVMLQLRYAGLLQVCEIRRNGYPVRKTHVEFVKRYAPLGKLSDASEMNGSTTSDVTNKLVDLLITQLCEEGVLYGDEWRKGKEKILMRQKQYDDVEVALGLAMWAYAAFVQRRMRGSMARIRFRKFKQALTAIETTMILGNIKALRESLTANCQILPHKGNSGSVQLAKIRAKIDEWEKLSANVTNQVEAFSNEQNENTCAQLQIAVDQAVEAGLVIAENDVLKVAQNALDKSIGLSPEQQNAVDTLKLLVNNNVKTSAGVAEAEVQLSAIQTALDQCRISGVADDNDALERGVQFADTLVEWLAVERGRIEQKRVAALEKEEAEAKARAVAQAAAETKALEEKMRLVKEQEAEKLHVEQEELLRIERERQAKEAADAKAAKAQAEAEAEKLRHELEEERKRLAALEEEKRAELEREKNEQLELSQALLLAQEQQKIENAQLRREIKLRQEQEEEAAKLRIERDRVAALEKEKNEAKAVADAKAFAEAKAQAEEELRLVKEKEIIKVREIQEKEQQRLAAIEESKRVELETERNEHQEVVKGLVLVQQQQKEETEKLRRELNEARDRVMAMETALLDAEAMAKSEEKAAKLHQEQEEKENRLRQEAEEERQRLKLIGEEKRIELERERNEQRELAKGLMVAQLLQQKVENEQLQRELSDERDEAVSAREILVAELEDAKRNAVIQAQTQAAARVRAEWGAKRDREISELLKRMKGEKEFTEQQSKIALEEATRAMEQRMDTEIRDAVIRVAAEVVVEYQIQKQKALKEEEEEEERQLQLSSSSSEQQQSKGVTTREPATSLSSTPESNAARPKLSTVPALLAMPGHEPLEDMRLAIQAMLDERDRMEDALRSDIRGVFDARKQQELEFLSTVQQRLGRDAVAALTALTAEAAVAEVSQTATQLITEQHADLNEMRLLFQKFVSSLCFSEDRFLEQVNDVSRRLGGATGGVSAGKTANTPIAKKKPPPAQTSGLGGLIAMCGGSHR